MTDISQERPVIDAETAKPVAPEESLGAAPLRQRSFRSRFVWLYAALAVIAGASVAAFLVLVARDDEAGSLTPVQQAWSDWSPEGSPYNRAQDIADHVSGRYRLPSGQQLAAAIAGPPVITSNQPEGSTQILVSTIAITPDIPAGGRSSTRDIVLVNASNSLQYVLCGYGQNCSIATGQPSVERHTLLRREALELALYTFRYMPQVDSVSVFLPPRPDNSTSPTMVFLQRKDVLPALTRPLQKSLSTETPGIGKIAPDELALVNRVTSTRLYQYNYTQAQDGSAVMLLDPVVT